MRSAGRVPAVIYGRQAKPQNLEVSAKEKDMPKTLHMRASDAVAVERLREALEGADDMYLVERAADLEHIAGRICAAVERGSPTGMISESCRAHLS